ncbi:MAG: ABC transporter ATP-binding protein [Deltaproteobacteria bacterium]|nr:ABC transporter ATP-binding protein [Deltaproteobacteria bacterium]
MSSIIKVENISKSYRIGKKVSYGSLRDEIMQTITALFKRHSMDDVEDNKIWALKDVSFEVKEGEVLGIIGKNGAGKSTLLKILSRITEPTSGRIAMRGRVVSLLEVGTGFHPELTGRENIYLNGAILGMTKKEIHSKFDEIVAFAEIEKFLDTPVKRYSSGMYVRLAFAVAAHLEPEILIVDEVLAVGDAAFQKKCLGKMGDVGKEGRTVLFVSHNMGAVKSLCSSALFISEGKLMAQGAVGHTIEQYFVTVAGEVADEGVVNWPDSETAPGGKEMRLVSIRLLDRENRPGSNFDTGKAISVEITYRLFEKIRGMRLILQLINSEGVIAFTSTDEDLRSDENSPGLYRTVCTIPGGLLNSGLYFVLIHSGCPGVKVLVCGKELIRFHAEKTGQHGSLYPEKWLGVIAPKLEWKTEVL